MLNLDYRDARPIYEQVRDNLRRLMVSGAIQEGEKLPSVRSLASNLAINPNTIQRAYESLEAEGYVYSIPGKGSFAAPRTGVDEERRDRLLGQFDRKKGERSNDQGKQRRQDLRRLPRPGWAHHGGGEGLHLWAGGP